MAAAAATTVPQGAPAEPSVQIPQSIEQITQFLTATVGAAEVNDVLKKVGANKEAKEQILASLLPSGEDPLSLLDVKVNTLGWLYILSARLTVTGAALPQLPLIQTFCSNFRPEEARLAPDRITMLAKGIVRTAGEEIAVVLKPLRDLVLRYPPSPAHLTNIHPMFLNACVSTRSYAAALPILTSPVYEIDTKTSELHWNDNLLYHYAGGVAFGALKRWQEAEEFFEICVTAPAQTPASLQLEALKKLTLVQLILYGKAMSPPKYTNQILIRNIKNSPYHNFAKNYPQTRAQLTTTVTKDVELFRTEQNFGLVQQAIERAPRWLIKKLTRTYLTLGLRDIAQEVGIDTEDEVRSIIVSMVESDEVNASISVDGTVTFVDAAPQISKTDIELALAQAQEQSKILYRLERNMNVSKEYLLKAIKHKDENWGTADEDIYAGPGSYDDSLY